MTKEKKYCVQKIYYEDKAMKLVVWKDTGRCSDSIDVLKILCGGRNYRIINRETQEVVYELE